MRLADDGIAGDAAAQLFGDLAGGLATIPEFFEQFDAVLGLK
jgi:hypothetical protein